MPSVIKPLFRPDVLISHIRNLTPSPAAREHLRILEKWSRFLVSGNAREFNERNLLPDFLTDIFYTVLGYVGPVDGAKGYTINREQIVQVDGKAADAVLGYFTADSTPNRFVVAVEGKGPRDPLDRPFGGRSRSAVEQGYGYAINLPCDWILVTSMRETRLYYKGADQFTCEIFDIHSLASEDAQYRKFLFLLHASRVLPDTGPSHLLRLYQASEQAGRKLTRDYYEHYANIRHDAFLHLCRENPSLDRPFVLAATQKLLDRVLFCAFCEDRGLLPPDTIKSAFEHRDPYNPRPVWQNFRGLFRSIHEGNKTLNIPQYNGGLFAPDPLVDELTVPDPVCEFFRQLGEYEYGVPEILEAGLAGRPPARLVDVAILGHIFEQSITDLERLRAELDGTAPAEDVSVHKQRRKREGAFYTPDYITRLIVEKTVGPVLRDRLETLRLRHWKQAGGTAKKILENPEVYDLDALNAPQRDALILFWEAWKDVLTGFRVLDAAAGSGAFLIEAFDQLYAAYQAVNQRLEELRGVPELFDLNREILQRNLYGVDLNEEAVEICRLSLWIKTAERGKILTSLDHTIRVGNSVISDPAVHPLAFDWAAAFPEAAEQGGFDVVIGNPPYIRQEWLAPYKDHFKDRFHVYSGSADLYLYFFETGLRLLKPGGMLGFITSGTFARGNFAVPFRKWIPSVARFEALVNFGENQPFEGAEMVYPTISILRKTTAPKPFPTLFIGGTSIPHSIEAEFETSALECGPEALLEPEWRFQPREVAALFQKIIEGKRTLGELYGKGMYRGVLTGFNDAFLIDGPTRDRLVAEDPASAQLIKKILRGEDLRPWYQENEDRWLIFTRRGVEIGRYPAIRNHLERFRESLEPRPDDWNQDPSKWPGRKPGSYQWYGIQDSVDYYQEFEKPKILWPDISKLPRFSWDDSGLFVNDKGFILRSDDPWILSILHSRIHWFCISQLCLPLRLRGGLWQYQCKKQFVARLPLPETNEEKTEILARLALQASDLARDRIGHVEKIRHRLRADLGGGAGLNTRLSEWWKLDFAALREEARKAFKADVPLRERGEWEEALQGWKNEFQRRTDQLIAVEEEINDRVNHLFGLSGKDVETLHNHARQSSTFYPLGEV